MKSVSKTSEEQPTLAVAVAEQGALATTQNNAVGGLSVMQVFEAIVKNDVSTEKVQVLRELLAMDAERQFASAFVALQKDLPTIVATSTIPNRGKYERFEDVMKQIQPMLTKHGFTLSFSMDVKDNRILETCHLTHGGCTRSNSFAVRTRKADSDTQADCMAATTAKRNALLNALNIVIRQDVLNEEHDAGMEGDPDAKITAEQADKLEHRVKMTNSDVVAFLKFAGADKFSNILASKYALLDGLLRRREVHGR